MSVIHPCLLLFQSPAQDQKAVNQDRSPPHSTLPQETRGATGGVDTACAEPSRVGDRPPTGNMADIAEDRGDEEEVKSEERSSRGTIVRRESIEIGEDPLQGLMGWSSLSGAWCQILCINPFSTRPHQNAFWYNYSWLFFLKILNYSPKEREKKFGRKWALICHS